MPPVVLHFKVIICPTVHDHKIQPDTSLTQTIASNSVSAPSILKERMSRFSIGVQCDRPYNA